MCQWSLAFNHEVTEQRNKACKSSYLTVNSFTGVPEFCRVGGYVFSKIHSEQALLLAVMGAILRPNKFVPRASTALLVSMDRYSEES